MTVSHPEGFFMKQTSADVHRDPARNWLVIFAVSVIAFIGIVVWNVWTFNTVARGGVIGTPLSEAPPFFDRSSLDTIRSIFVSRAEEEARYVTGTYRYTDPSQ